MKTQIRKLYSILSVKSGLTKMMRKINKHEGAIIFVGHQVNETNDNRLEPLPPKYLDEQIAYLKKHFQFLSLSKLLECYEFNQPIPPKTVVLTFDDGFRDNYTYAFPILQKYGVTATIFLTTGCIDSGEFPWSQRLGYMITNTTVKTIHLPQYQIFQFNLESETNKTYVFRTLAKVLSETPFIEREQLLNQFQQVFQVIPPKDRMLTWDMIQEMKQNGFEFGGHTVSHPHLTKIPPQEAKQEIRNCLETIRLKLGVENPPFAFPAGKSNDDLVEYVKLIGFRSCFRSSYKRRYNTLSNSNPFRLSRLGLPNAPAIFLEAEVDGLLYWVRKSVQK
ncbi:MAG: polysaccharide deacetylase family protein [bacterium]|nr:polysaccharide deacetylase family protein [bacterium]